MKMEPIAEVLNAATAAMHAFYTDPNNHSIVNQKPPFSSELWHEIFCWFFNTSPTSDDDPLWDLLINEFYAYEARERALNMIIREQRTSPHHEEAA